MNKKGVLLIISGPSGVGKGTVMNEILKRKNNVVYSVSATTRAIRPGEVPNVNYYYKSWDEFDDMIKTGEILEWDTFCGDRYGTPKTPLELNLKAGKDVLLDITVSGALAVKKAFPKDSISIFLEPPSLAELERRLRNRKTETETKINERLSKAASEIEQKDKFDYIVVNDNLTLAVQKVMDIMEKEKKI